MILYSDKLTRAELDAFAAALDLTLYNAGDFHGPRARRISFTLRPTGERYRRSARGRRLWAVSWEGHWEFMDRLFRVDPDARIKSAVSTWDGRDDFLARAGSPPDTGAGAWVA